MKRPYLKPREPSGMEWWTYLSFAAVIYVATIVSLRMLYPEKHLDWSIIDETQRTFPESFQWGVATASHQIEGGNSNNWTEFETRSNIEESGDACDHWNRWQEDFQLLEELGVATYRFSLEWSRIEPEKGHWNAEALQQYSDMIDDLCRRGIRPMITLHHFSHPQWFEQREGFLDKDNIGLWVHYCEKVFERYCDRVTDWCTVNEPEVFSIMGYFMKMFPPGKRSLRSTLTVMRNVVQAHGIVYHRLKQHNPVCRIGLAKNVTLFDPLKRWNLLHWTTSAALNFVWNGAIVRALKKGTMFGKKMPLVRGSLDFIGLNYYTHVLTSPFLPQTNEVNFPKRSHETMTDFGYPMYAEGLERAVKMLETLEVPIEITENGTADQHDTLRPIHLQRHVWMVSELLQQGHDIRSYYHWSLMDNFEWAEGYSLRFGLYHVDYQTQVRTLRQSGSIYRDIINEASQD